MSYRIEHDSLGEVRVPEEALWGAQTQRSVENFPIGIGLETMPREIIRAFAVLKEACARANRELVPARMTEDKLGAIARVCAEIRDGKLFDQFPLVVWQTGSGTQTNMNVNEVIAHRGTGDAVRLHPNDDCNMSQSSNDTFPSAMHIAAVLAVEKGLLPALESLIAAFRRIEEAYPDLLKSGRTHLMDAVPLRFCQEVSGWRSSLERDAELLSASLSPLRELAIGGTAVGTGLNAPEGFAEKAAEWVSRLTGVAFVSAPNKFHALTSQDEMVFTHGAMKALAADMMKIANDIRFLASGPRCGFGEISIPANEPGSSIMPGKVNPTQCEQVTMVAVQVMGNDTAVSMAASQGNFQLNVFMPVMAYNFLQSARLLAQSIAAFEERCVAGLRPIPERMNENLRRSLMLVTALNPVIGYEKAAKVAQKAFAESKTLEEACTELGYLSGDALRAALDPARMV